MIKIAIYRGLGGWGDVEMGLVAAGSYKLAHPDYHVTFVCPENLLPLTECYPFIDRAISTKEFNSTKGCQYAWYFDITNPCLNYEMKYQPNVDKSRIEIFCDWMNVKYNSYTLKTSPNMFSFLERKRIQSVRRCYKDEFVIGWITQSYSPIRKIPPKVWNRIADLVKGKIPNHMNVIIRGKRMAWEDMFWDPVTDKLIIDNNKREVLKILASCDLVIGGDTGPMHSVAMLGIPTIWLFTHIDGKIRTKEYYNVKIIQGECFIGEKPCWYLTRCQDIGEYKTPCAHFDPGHIFNEIFLKYLKSTKY